MPKITNVKIENRMCSKMAISILLVLVSIGTSLAYPAVDYIIGDPTPTPTSIATPIATHTAIHIAIPKVIPTPTITEIPTPTPTPIPTVATPTPTTIISNMPKAQIQVTYETNIVSGNDRQTIKVYITNIGTASANKINLTISHSHGLDPMSIAGSEKLDDVISWKGELKPGEEHIVEYSIKSVGGQEIDIPLRLTYDKISTAEKAKFLGISSTTSSASLTPEEQEVILLIIKVALPHIPGIGIVFIIAAIIAVYVIRKNQI